MSMYYSHPLYIEYSKLKIAKAVVKTSFVQECNSYIPRDSHAAMHGQIQTTSLVPRPGNEAIQTTSMNTYFFEISSAKFQFSALVL